MQVAQNETGILGAAQDQPSKLAIAYLSDSFAKRELFGLSRYAHELRSSLTSLGVSVTPISCRNEWSGEEPTWLVESGFRQIPIARRYLAPIWCHLPEPRIELWAGDADIVHSVDTDYPVATRKPWVLTVHDVGPLAHPEFFSKSHGWMMQAMLNAAARRADAVICISQATADGVLRFAPKEIESRIHVVTSGVSDDFFAPPAEPLVLPRPERPYFLFSGSMNPRKNLVNVVRAFASVADRIPHDLVIAGAGGWDSEQLDLEIANSPAHGRIVRPGYVSDGQLKALYASADAYLYLSLYEGFGLPILEAMASGCPVLTSNCSSMPEIAGNAALLADPLDPASIGENLVKLALTPSLRQDLRMQGLEWAKLFTWRHCAEETLAVYRSVI